jgi:hypothetical protein
MLIMDTIDANNKKLLSLIEEWEPILHSLPEDVISERQNSQNRTIRQIVGHMVDSASNNTHRIVHLQYGDNPLKFPNYATNGNNDRWISIQNYQEEDWYTLVQVWKYSNLHIIHVMGNVDKSRLSSQWHCSETKLISLEEGILDYLPHFRLHLNEIEELLDSE